MPDIFAQTQKETMFEEMIEYGWKYRTDIFA